jgi:hypothetical protein
MRSMFQSFEISVDDPEIVVQYNDLWSYFVNQLSQSQFCKDIERERVGVQYPSVSGSNGTVTFEAINPQHVDVIIRRQVISDSLRYAGKPRLLRGLPNK